MDGAVRKGLEDGAIVGRMGRAVGLGVMDEGVGSATKQLLGRVAEHAGRRGIGEAHAAVAVEAEDALPRSAQHELVSAAELLEGLFGVLAVLFLFYAEEGKGQILRQSVQEVPGFPRKLIRFAREQHQGACLAPAAANGQISVATGSGHPITPGLS
jgi:hypothetical protein